MYSDTDLESAVAAGVISPDQVSALRQHIAGLRATPAVDEEHFRLLTGFNDIFVGIAAVILLVAVAGSAMRSARGSASGPSPGGVAVARRPGAGRVLHRKRAHGAAEHHPAARLRRRVIRRRAFRRSRWASGLDDQEASRRIAASGAAGASRLAALAQGQGADQPSRRRGGAGRLGLATRIMLAIRKNVGDMMLAFALCSARRRACSCSRCGGNGSDRAARRAARTSLSGCTCSPAPLIVHPIFTLLGPERRRRDASRLGPDRAAGLPDPRAQTRSRWTPRLLGLGPGSTCSKR
jgi:hypothetical protein